MSMTLPPPIAITRLIFQSRISFSMLSTVCSLGSPGSYVSFRITWHAGLRGLTNLSKRMVSVSRRSFSPSANSSANSVKVPSKCTLGFTSNICMGVSRLLSYTLSIVGMDDNLHHFGIVHDPVQSLEILLQGI